MFKAADRGGDQDNGDDADDTTDDYDDTTDDYNDTADDFNDDIIVDYDGDDNVGISSITTSTDMAGLVAVLLVLILICICWRCCVWVRPSPPQGDIRITVVKDYVPETAPLIGRGPRGVRVLPPGPVPVAPLHPTRHSPARPTPPQVHHQQQHQQHHQQHHHQQHHHHHHHGSG